MRRTNALRVVAVFFLAALLTPVAVNGLTYQDDVNEGTTTFGARDDVLFVTTQGTVTLNGSKAKAVAIDTSSGDVVWRHTTYERYFDIDPLDGNLVLFLGADGPHGDNMWVNIVNYRTGEMVDRFAVPRDTHDVDYLGESRYIVADKTDHRLYEYDAESETIEWEYRYKDHYPPTAGVGYQVGSDAYTDYTHLNDVDVVSNQSKFLTSPRNFDRVTLINRSTKEVEWTLGEEDNYEILYEQHNPVLLTENPPTVLVADSENDRVVEYQKVGDDWELVWSYSGTLIWPRDADRLPNGNTLIVDSNGQRVLEVTPSRDVVWEISVVKNPYDAELLSLGDEPAGPPMADFADQFEAAEESDSGTFHPIRARFAHGRGLIQWVIPWHIESLDFLLLLGAVLLGFLWTSTEIARLYGPKSSAFPLGVSPFRVLFTLVSVVSVVLGVVLLTSTVTNSYIRPFWRGVGISALVIGLALITRAGPISGYLSSLPQTRTRLWASKWGSSVLCLGGTLALVVMSIQTRYLALCLGLGALLAQEMVRHLPEVTDTSWKYVHQILEVGVRVGSLVPAAVALFIGTGSSGFNYGYVGISLLLLGNVVTSTTTFAHRSAGSHRQTTIRGLRVATLILLVSHSLVLIYIGAEQPPLAPVYLALAVLLVHGALKLGMDL